MPGKAWSTTTVGQMSQQPVVDINIRHKDGVQIAHFMVRAGSGVKAEKQTPPEGIQTRSDNSEVENVDPNQEVKEVSQKSVSKPRLVKEQTHTESDARAVEVSRHKKRLRQ